MCIRDSSITSTVNFLSSPHLRYILINISAQSCASVPPDPAWISRKASLGSILFENILWNSNSLSCDSRLTTSSDKSLISESLEIASNSIKSLTLEDNSEYRVIIFSKKDFSLLSILAKILNKEKSFLEKIITLYSELSSNVNDLIELEAISSDSEIKDLSDEVVNLESQLKELEFQRMFSNKMDPNDAFLDIQAGSGGTEAQDWAEMLMRMYLRWGEDKKFTVEVIELSLIHISEPTRPC